MKKPAHSISTPLPDTTLSSSELVAPPKALSIPTEVCLEILKEHGLSYFDLRSIKGVCKKLESIVLLPDFDLLLFRDAPQERLERGTKITLHPALEHSILTIGTPEEAIIFGTDANGRDTEFQTTSLSCINEHATSPAVKLLYIHRIGDGGAVKNDSGVTVSDVITKIANLWNEPAPDVFTMERTSTGTTVNDVSYLSVLFENDHNGWAGWRKPIVADQSGKVVIQPAPYDS